MIGAALGGVAVAGCAAAYVCPHVKRGAHIRRMARWCAEHGAVALTYDDGPSDVLTERVLGLLEARSVKATFFLLGTRAERAMDTADRVKAAGHDVGCHTHAHLNAWKTWPWASVRDIARGYDTLARWVELSGVFRPPHGKMTLFTAMAIRRRGARVGWWTVDSGDTWAKLPNVEDVVERVRRAGGGVVLLHDFDRDGADAEERATFVLDVTRDLLDLAEREGWRVITMGEVMKGAGLA